MDDETNEWSINYEIRKIMRSHRALPRQHEPKSTFDQT